MRSIHCGEARPPESGLPVFAVMTKSNIRPALDHLAGVHAAG